MRLKWPLLLVVCAGCSFQASCGGKSLNMDKAKKFVGGSLAVETGEEPTEVSCPDKVKIEKGTSFDCTVTFGGPTAKVTMRQDDDEGNVTVTAISGILISRKAEGIIAKEVSSTVNAQVTVDCGDRVRTAKAGEAFSCTATAPDGAKAQIDVIVKDDQGNVRWALISPTAPAGGAPPVPPTAETPPASPARVTP
ncbi:MAG: DUF4333 domain-containing protein [Myxococcota bacterium]|nr:DUF4333 domain-containing protein [Myxococcota bacterium]